MKDELLFESCLDDLLKNFVRNEIKVIKNEGYEDGFYEPSDVDYESEFCDWINKKVEHFAENVDWSDITEQITQLVK